MTLPATFDEVLHRPPPRDLLRVGVIGGGAVAERIHLPALARRQDVIISGLAELDGERRGRLAEEFHIRVAVSDYRELVGCVDAAIVALPHHLHAPVASELLSRGVHVLVEKPMAMSTRECDRMIAEAESAGLVLAAGLVRRFAFAPRFAKHAIDTHLLGDLSRFELSEGRVYQWNVASAFPLERQSGGVLADIGAHVLDLVLWWFGDCAHVSYSDDARGGVEADCLVDVTMQSGISGTIELSRSRTLRDICTIRGSRGTLEIGTKLTSDIRLRLHGSEAVFQSAPAATESTSASVFDSQLEDFVRAVRDGHPPAVPGTEARRSVGLMERCYERRQPLDRLWDRVEQRIERNTR